MEFRDFLENEMFENESLLDAYHVVLSDGRVVYEGWDVEKMRQVFLSAGRCEVKRVSHLVNGVEMAFSYMIEARS